MRRLVIIGGGFGGLNLAKGIDKKKWEVVIVDRNNYHSFPPLFYQVASSGLEPASICFPLRREMRARRVKGCEFRMGEVREIDTSAHTVTTNFETLTYDTLVIAAGSTNNFFGIDGLRDKVYTIKSVTQAMRCRNEVLDRLERAAISTDAEERRRMLTFLIAGGGPAGVEIAGALGEMKRFVLPREYPQINPEEVRVILVEASPSILGAMGRKSSADALKALSQLLVEVHTGKALKNYENGKVSFDDGSSIATDTVIWTAGITAESFEFKGATPARGAGNRLVVDEYNRLEGVADVFAIGDIAIHTSPEQPRGCPQLAQGAIQQGRNLARNLNAGVMTSGFRYHDKGTMATIGRNRAVADIGPLHISGRMAWIAWMGVHILTLLGMRNKVVVFINWMWSYFTFSSGLRLLFRPTRYPLRRHY